MKPPGLGKSFVGTVPNMPPEILNKYNYEEFNKFQGYDQKTNIWSLGTICYEMLNGQYLFNSNNKQELIEIIKKGNCYPIPIDIEASYEIISFLSSMLQYKPEKEIICWRIIKTWISYKNVNDFMKGDSDENPNIPYVNFSKPIPFNILFLKQNK